MKMCKGFPLKFSDTKLAVASRHRTVSHLHFHHGIFYQKNMTVVLYPPYFYLFPLLKIKLKDRHFDTTEEIEAEAQPVLNTLTEIRLRGCTLKGRSVGKCAYARKWTTSRVMVDNRSQVTSSLHGSISPRNYG
jgi:hypothetical protein